MDTGKDSASILAPSLQRSAIGGTRRQHGCAGWIFCSLPGGHGDGSCLKIVGESANMGNLMRIFHWIMRCLYMIYMFMGFSIRYFQCPDLGRLLQSSLDLVGCHQLIAGGFNWFNQEIMDGFDAPNTSHYLIVNTIFYYFPNCNGIKLPQKIVPHFQTDLYFWGMRVAGKNT